MKDKFKKGLIYPIIFILLFTGVFYVSAADNANTIGEAQGFIDGIVMYQQRNSGTSSIQGWINTSLIQNAGSSSEWYIIALSQYGTYDFSSYENALINYLNNNEVSSASSRQKYALVLISIGSTNSYIHEILNNSIGQQGVMSWIFGLHLLNNGYKSDEYSLSAVREKLLSLQLSDGGWAVTGNNSDVDVTAMAIQALSSYYYSDSSVRTAVDNALNFLSARQKENGDFASYGVNNPESTAQVLIALSSLGIDCASDSRFIKNGNTIFDGIALYQLSDGSFCHKQGGGYNGTATVQVFYSMVSYLRMKNGQSSLFTFDKRNPSGLKKTENISPEETSSNTGSNVSDNLTAATKAPQTNNTSDSNAIADTSNAATTDTTDDSLQNSSALKATENSSAVTATEKLPETTESVDSDLMSTEKADVLENKTDNSSKNHKLQDIATEEITSKSVSYKLWVCVSIAIVAIITGIILYVRKKRNIHNFVMLGAISAVLILLVLLINFQSTDSYYSQAAQAKGNAVGRVKISILCDTISDKSAEHIPEDGIILSETEVEIENGDTVYQVLSEVTAKNKIHLETNGSGDSVYVQGIGNIYEFDFGDLSGWMYLVNGEVPTVSCGEYVLSAGDEIEWCYTCSLGEDI